MTAMTAARDHALAGAVLISAADMGKMGELPHDKLVALQADNMESLAGVTAESMADEVSRNAKRWEFANAVAGLKDLPLLVLSADDGLAPQTDALVAAIRAKGGTHIQAIHQATDHGWSDHRIFLEAAVIDWLNKLK